MGAVSTSTLITVAPTGAETAKTDAPACRCPSTSWSPRPRRCEAAGAALIHIHIRDDDAQPDPRRRRLTDTVAAVRESTDLVVQLSHGRRGHRPLRRAARGPRRRARLLLAHLRHGQLRRRRVHQPVALHGRALPAYPGARDRAGVRAVRPRPRRRAEPAPRQGGRAVRRPRPLRPRAWGSPAACPGTTESSSRRWPGAPRRVPRGRPPASGRSTLPVALAALSAGGHLRVGMEDTLTYSPGRPVRDNAQLVSVPRVSPRSPCDLR